MRSALQRMETYRPLIEGKIHGYGVPEELMAVPIVETGYQNLPGHGAGLWSFIASTARNFGLRVDSTIDERMTVDLETDAAMRLLQSNYLRFGDWSLSVLAYNMGEGGLEKGIEKFKTRDAWQLIHSGVEGDKDYLAKVMAAVLVMKNPSSVD